MLRVSTHESFEIDKWSIYLRGINKGFDNASDHVPMIGVQAKVGVCGAQASNLRNDQHI